MTNRICYGSDEFQGKGSTSRGSARSRRTTYHVCTQRIKIGVISTMGGSPWGASEELWAVMLDEALGKGHAAVASVYGWDTTPPRLATLERAGVHVLRRPMRSGRLRRRFKAINQPFRGFFKLDPDVVLVSQGATYDALYRPELLSALYSSGKPYSVLCNLGIETTVLTAPVRAEGVRFFGGARGVFFVSTQNLRLAEHQLATRLANGAVVQNPVNLAERSIVGWDMPESPVHMACVARLETQYKGQDLLFQVLGSPAWSGREWVLKLYGIGADEGYLHELAAYYGISGKVELCGFVSDVRAVWRENHLLVLPSRAEGVPMVVVEAALCGRPVVATNTGAVVDWVRDGETGFIAENPAVESLAAALERAWRARTEWREMGIAAHAAALAKLDPSPGKTLLDALLSAT